MTLLQDIGALIFLAILAINGAWLFITGQLGEGQ